MATSSARPTRVYHQDYIARIRYSNALPPPPIPPKLLDIPNTGLAGGQYTSAGFASRLAREQPLNIEADAELGMPIDLVGLPGIFDGDESSIQGFDEPPHPHPHDRPLLRPLSTLGKPSTATTGVSFLRRTEYISSDQGRARFESNPSKDLIKSRNNAKRKRQPDLAKDDPINIIRHIAKGFDIAYPKDAYTGPDTGENIKGAESTATERSAWNTPRHPTNPDLTLLDSYPVLPDLEAFPDTGSYMVVKYQTNPLGISESYDPRLDVAVLRPLRESAELAARYEAQSAAYEADSTQPHPGPAPFDYEVFLPAEGSSVRNIHRKFDIEDPEKEEEDLYDHRHAETGKAHFDYKRLRAYETYQQTGNSVDVYGEVVALALHDPELDVGAVDGSEPTATRRLQKAAYYYAVDRRAYIRPRRERNVPHLAMTQPAGDNDSKIDRLLVIARDPNEEEIGARDSIRAKYDVAMAA